MMKTPMSRFSMSRPEMAVLNAKTLIINDSNPAKIGTNRDILQNNTLIINMPFVKNRDTTLSRNRDNHVSRFSFVTPLFINQLIFTCPDLSRYFMGFNCCLSAVYATLGRFFFGTFRYTPQNTHCGQGKFPFTLPFTLLTHLK